MLVVFPNSSWMLRRRKLGRKRKKMIVSLMKSREGKRRKLKNLSKRRRGKWMMGLTKILLRNQIEEENEVLLCNLEMRMELM